MNLRMLTQLPDEEHCAFLTARHAKYVGKRVRFVSFAGEDPEPLTIGEEGLVIGMDMIGTLHVNWDSGRGLGILLEDEVEVLHA